MIFLACKDLSKNSTHDLATASLGEIRNHEDGLGGCKWSNAFPDLQDKILLQLVIDLVSILDSNESIDSLSGKLIADTDNGSFGYGRILDESSFDFRSGEAVTTDIDDIVDTSSDPVVSFMITSSSIARELSWA